MDNVSITVGAGTTIATDDVAGVHYPRNKISLGADGSATDAKSTDLDSGAGSDIALVTAIGVPASGGGVIITGDGANGLDVDVTRLPGTVASDITAIKTAVEALDNAVSGSELQVDLVGPIPAGTNNIGDVDVATLPGTVQTDIAAIKTSVELLDNAIAGSEVQVDIVASLPAGTNNIGDVDVLTLPGTVQSDISAIKTAVELLDNAVSGSEIQVDVVAAIPAGTNIIGKVQAVNGFESTENIFVATVLASAAGASKNHLSIFNADATIKIDILQAYVTKEMTAAVTGLTRGHRLFRFGTVHSAGAVVTPLQLDTAMGAIDADVTVRSGSTVSGAEAIPLGAIGVNEEETGSGGGRMQLFDWKDYNRPITLNQNQGVTIQQDSTAGTGLVSCVIVFRQR